MGKTVIFITHDLDEAMRIGDRIAIMKDGAIIQTGTPEEIVTAPQQDYVVRFVADISRMKVASTARIIKPLHAYRADAAAEDVSTLRSVQAGTKLADLVDLFAEGRAPISRHDRSTRVNACPTRLMDFVELHSISLYLSSSV